ncbi:SDR family NAD(P)-dependent oxidoreductase [Streptomyces sp. NPDC091879]|uniref:SDR family NAD(P)-dependent oxidoreductase n=1 Tax=Streptomyces sp. NPDC091879 TaxID=3366006 RepID=UPI00381036FC
MDLHLNGRTAVVTGASRGIGLAVAGALVREGARVVTGSREITPELRALAAEGDVLSVAVDLTAPEGPAELIAAATFAYGGLDILVNNVGAVRPRTDGLAADLRGSDAELLATQQRPVDLAALQAPSGVPAWKTIPSWYLVAGADRAIPAATEKFMAHRAGAHTVVVDDASHLVMLSHPGRVENLIVQAAKATD